MKKFTCIISFACLLYGSEDILSKKLEENLKLKKDRVEKSSDVLENSWINPLSLAITKGKNRVKSEMGGEEYFNGSISLNQDIFRSGGIFYAIKYADASRILGLSQIQSERNTKTISAYTLLLKILKNDKLQAQQNLYIKNSILDIKRKKEQYLAGLIDISFLNNAILAKIGQENALLSLEDAKENLISEFEKLSDKDYKNIDILHVKTPTKDEYIRQNITLSIQKNSILNKKLLHKLTTSQYLPKLSINASYNLTNAENRQLDNSDKFYNYGLTLSMPLDIKTFDDIEKSKLEYLVAQNEYEILKENQAKEYDKITKDLLRIDKKISLAKENIKIYNSLLSQTKELVEAEIKISDDLDIMQNSKDIRSLEIEIFGLEKEEKRLEFYKNLIL